MTLLDSLVECGATPERAQAMLDRVLDANEQVAQQAYRDMLRTLTPMLLQVLAELAREERRNG